jgi:uroporphyrinogen III methyltransferase/synthase
MTAGTGIDGLTVLVTRSEEDCADWAARLDSRGARPVALPCIRCETIDDPALRSTLAAAAAATDWIAFTSARGVEAFVALGAHPSARAKIAAVGRSTAKAAEEAFGRVDLVAGGTAALLAGALASTGVLAAGSRVLLALAENAGDVLERELGSAGARCTRLDLYRTVPAPMTGTKRAISTLGADNVLLASPSAVTGFVHQIEIDKPVRIFTIGPSTTAAARRAGLTVTAEAREPSFDGMVEAMQWRT